MNVGPIDHIGLNVRNLPISFAFYERVFGFSILHKWHTTWMIQNGEIKLGLFQRPNAVPICKLDQTVAVSHVAFRTDAAGFREAQSQLAQLGVPFTPPEDTGIALSIFILDPDGHQVEITTYDRPASPVPQRVTGIVESTAMPHGKAKPSGRPPRTAASSAK